MSRFTRTLSSLGRSTRRRRRLCVRVQRVHLLQPRRRPGVCAVASARAAQIWRSRGTSGTRCACSSTRRHLAASTDLKSDLDGPIAQSEFFILLASTQAASPESWVGKEVSYWREHKDMRKFLIAKTDGEISWDEATNDFDWEKTTALPRSLAKAFRSEPNFVDFSAWQSDVDLRADPAFREAVARLATPIHHKESMEELVGEDLDQQRRTKRLVRAAVATLVALLIAACVAAVLAYQQRNTARTQLAKATSLALASAADNQPADDFDVSLLLSLEAYRASPTAQAKSSMISALDAARRSGARDDPPSAAKAPSSASRSARTGARSPPPAATGRCVLWDPRTTTASSPALDERPSRRRRGRVQPGREHARRRRRRREGAALGRRARLPTSSASP